MSIDAKAVEVRYCPRETAIGNAGINSGVLWVRNKHYGLSKDHLATE